jgi:hypothetical protein
MYYTVDKQLFLSLVMLQIVKFYSVMISTAKTVNPIDMLVLLSRNPREITEIKYTVRRFNYLRVLMK